MHKIPQTIRHIEDPLKLYDDFYYCAPKKEPEGLIWKLEQGIKISLPIRKIIPNANVDKPANQGERK